MTVLELSANGVMILSIFLAGRNSVHTWWTGIIGCILFALLFYQVNLYADVLLQTFFIFTSVIGWWQWNMGLEGKPRKITKIENKTLIKIIPFGVVVVFIYGLLLYLLTDAYAPFIDSGVLVFSVIAQILMMKRRIDSWKFWLLVNTIAVPLYASRELYVTAGLYACYWVNAIVAYQYWKREMSTESALDNNQIESLANEAG